MTKDEHHQGGGSGAARDSGRGAARRRLAVPASLVALLLVAGCSLIGGGGTLEERVTTTMEGVGTERVGEVGVRGDTLWITYSDSDHVVQALELSRGRSAEVDTPKIPILYRDVPMSHLDLPALASTLNSHPCGDGGAYGESASMVGGGILQVAGCSGTPDVIRSTTIDGAPLGPIAGWDPTTVDTTLAELRRAHGDRTRDIEFRTVSDDEETNDIWLQATSDEQHLPSGAPCMITSTRLGDPAETDRPRLRYGPCDPVAPILSDAGFALDDQHGAEILAARDLGASMLGIEPYEVASFTVHVTEGEIRLWVRGTVASGAEPSGVIVPLAGYVG